MNKIIELLPTKLIGVLISENVNTNRVFVLYGDKTWILELQQDSNKENDIIINLKTNCKECYFAGTITFDYKFDFNCEKYLNKIGKRFFEYLKPGMMTVSSVNHNFPFENSKDSFISLLKANNIEIQTNQKLLILEKL